MEKVTNYELSILRRLAMAPEKPEGWGRKGPARNRVKANLTVTLVDGVERTRPWLVVNNSCKKRRSRRNVQYPALNQFDTCPKNLT